MGGAIGIYFLLMFLIAFLMPLVVPTDVRPPGAKPLSWQAVGFGIASVYVVPAVVAWLDYGERRRAGKPRDDRQDGQCFPRKRTGKPLPHGTPAPAQ